MEELLKAILDDPDKIDGLSQSELEGVRGLLAGYGDVDPDQATAEDISAMEAAVVLAERVDGRLEAIAVENAERAEKAALLKSRLVPEVSHETVEDEEVEVVVPDDASEIIEEQTVTASKAGLAAMRTLIPKESKPSDKPALAMKSPNGDLITKRTDYAKAAEAVFKGLGSHYPSTGFSLFPVATLETHRHKYTFTDSADNNGAVLAKVVAEEQAKAKGGIIGPDALTAAFCAPNEPIYDLFNITSRAGLLNLPSVNADRGGFIIPDSLSLSDILGDSGIAFEWDADTDASPGATTKPVFEVECPTFVTCEVSAWVTRLRFRNTVRRFWPELYADITAKALVAAARTINAARLAALAAFDTPITTTASALGSAPEIASRVGALGYAYREREGMSPEATLDAVFPAWVLDLMVADLVSRSSTTDYGNARARVSALFASLNLRAQFVYDMQAFNQTTSAAALVYLFAPGTAVLADGGTLNLGEVRDSTLNSTNRYETFVESFETVCFPGHRIDSTTLNLCEIGTVATAVASQCGPPAA